MVVRGFCVIMANGDQHSLLNYEPLIRRGFLYFFENIISTSFSYFLCFLCADCRPNSIGGQQCGKGKYDINLSIWKCKREAVPPADDIQRVMVSAYGWCHPMNESRQTKTIRTHLVCKRQSRHRQSSSLSHCRLIKVQTTRDIIHYFMRINPCTYDSRTSSQSASQFMCGSVTGTHISRCGWCR